MKTKITFEEAFKISETLIGVLQATKPEGMKPIEIKSLFMLKKFDTNNLKEIKEKISKDFYHVPKHILEVKIAKTLRSLWSKGLIKKEKCEEDKRQALIIITPKGEKFLNETYKASKAKWEETVYG